MKTGSGKTFGVKQATTHATYIRPPWLANHIRRVKESAYSPPLNLPDLFSENETEHFLLYLKILFLRKTIAKINNLFR